jgi:hypothetical protein
MPSAFNITASLATLRQSLAWLAWCRHRFAPCGVAKVQLCLAPLSCAAWPALHATLRPHVSVLARKTAPAQSFSQALRAAVVGGVSPAHPAVTATRLALRCSFPRVCACSRPPPLGAPLRSKAKPQALPSTGIFSTNAVKVLVLITLCVFNESAGHHAVQG